MELGRSFVHPDYQSRSMGRKSLFALDNLWDGLGAIIIDNHHLKVPVRKSNNVSTFQSESQRHDPLFSE